MDDRLQRRVQRYGWDRAAALYESGWREQLEPAQRRMLALADLRSGERVLDLACGTGLASFAAADRVGPKGTVLGADISQEMVLAARRLAAERGSANVVFERMEAESLRVRDASFDVALCALGLMYVPDPGAALREIHRALAPGGRVALAVWGARARCGWAEVFPIVERRVRSTVCPLFFRLGTGDALVRELAAQGFAGTRTERLATTLRYASAEAALEAAFSGGPVALAYSRFDRPTREAVRAEYLASIAPFRTGAGYAIPGEFVIAAARRDGGRPP